MVKRTFTIEEIESAMSDMLACGYEQSCCEPDARRYTCEECGEKQVYMGVVV